MKLYYSKGACSLSPHIILEELGLPFELVRVQWEGEGFEAFKKIHPMAVVPVLQLENGEILTEGVAIAQYLADLKPEKGLAPKLGTFERVRLWECLNFISSEIHKGFSPLFAYEGMTKDEAARDDIWNFAVAGLSRKFDLLEKKLSSRDFITGANYTIADAYLYTVMSWTKGLEISLDKWPKLKAYVEKIGERPATQNALKAERLV